ncbi:muscle M-line assembly protein unc-89-like isoform X1 [Erpetoichthys calabaricus]|uniref:muscle M-line assembly protein unc-89-like isoform X1 n=1 Tax=Erpetoichthys calabaricus TaxID=27687 RepID=UPI002233FCA4|nr:muscle M-line assembly protein unc-89-like isoform X1 [Erpetoichthys calabaricus]
MKTLIFIGCLLSVVLAHPGNSNKTPPERRPDREPWKTEKFPNVHRHEPGFGRTENSTASSNRTMTNSSSHERLEGRWPPHRKPWDVNKPGEGWHNKPEHTRMNNSSTSANGTGKLTSEKGGPKGPHFGQNPGVFREWEEKMSGPSGMNTTKAENGTRNERPKPEHQRPEEPKNEKKQEKKPMNPTKAEHGTLNERPKLENQKPDEPKNEKKKEKKPMSKPGKGGANEKEKTNQKPPNKPQFVNKGKGPAVAGNTRQPGTVTGSSVV